MTSTAICCSICERNRFSTWRRACELLELIRAIDKEAISLPPFAEKATEQLYLAIWDRLQGAHPLGMAERIMRVAVAVIDHHFASASIDLADLEEDERKSQELNPSERSCPRGFTVDDPNRGMLMLSSGSGSWSPCPTPVLARIGPFAIHLTVAPPGGEVDRAARYSVTHAQSGKAAACAPSLAKAKRFARVMAGVEGVSWDFSDEPSKADIGRVSAALRAAGIGGAA